jgi:hypothetical protein
VDSGLIVPFFNPCSAAGDLLRLEVGRVGKGVDLRRIPGLEEKVLIKRGQVGGDFHKSKAKEKAKARMARRGRVPAGEGGRHEKARAIFSRGLQPLAEMKPPCRKNSFPPM